jgi:hypothetical protein
MLDNVKQVLQVCRHAALKAPSMYLLCCIYLGKDFQVHPVSDPMRHSACTEVPGPARK